MNKEKDIMDFLHKNVFDPVLNSPMASKQLKAGVNLTIIRLQQRDARGMVGYFWSAIIGTEKSTRFAKMMKQEGFIRFEEMIEELRERFNDKWLAS